MDESLLRQRLATLPIPAMRYFPSTGSTNDEALAWAEDGAPDGALVVADEQTRGRGRMERRWVTRPGAALAFSLALRPSKAEQRQSGLFSPLGALAVSEALMADGLSAAIKWPNDVLVAGRKVCGILAESVWQDQQLQAVVVGIGVNVSPDSVPPAGELNFPATSLETELGREVDRIDLLAGILQAFYSWRPRLGSPQFFQTWEQRLAFRGKPVCVIRAGGEEVYGQLAGIGPDGSLRLRLNDDREELVLAGEVSLRPVGWDEKPMGGMTC